MSLSPQEQRILDIIEDHLIRDDPALTSLLSRRSAAVVCRTYLRPAALLSVLAGVLVVLVLAYPMAAPGGPAAVGLLTATLVVPWMVAAARVFARARASGPGHRPSDHRNAIARSAHGPGHHRRATAVTRTSLTGPRVELAIGLAVGAVVVALVAGAVEITLPVVAVVLLVASYVLRWYARRALFGRSRRP